MSIEPNNSQTPFAASTIAKFIDVQIENLKDVKTDLEIANEIGYETTLIISMFRHGLLPVPLGDVPRLARALGVDAGHLFRLALEQ
ncbi:MAG: hypothetical protein ACLQB4_18080 [Beijerinckiaceae bacterium]